MNVTVVGLGKIGLPLALQFAKKGSKVFGSDINQETVNLVNKGIEPFPGEANLQEYLSEMVASGMLAASTNTTECVSRSTVVVVVVPLFVDKYAEPDFRAMDSATEDIAKGLQRGTLVSYETTLPVGTTRNRFTKMLERISGLKLGEDFHVSFSPERVLTGRVFSDLRKYPKIVGGVTPACAIVAERFYIAHLDFDDRPDLSRRNGVWVLDSAESAEFVKLAETTYRDVNIGLANQFAKFADRNKLDIDAVILAANSQPFSNIHSPGISVGGHCIPVYPQFYLWQDRDASIVREAREVNDKMPTYIVDKIADEIGDLKEKKTLVLGISYRPGVKESAFSGIFSVADRLAKLGAHVFVHDPFYTSEEVSKIGFNPQFISEDIEIIIVHTDHPNYTKDFFAGFRDRTLIYSRANFFSTGNLQKF
jgi:nucleotide sugar dehydrogenase